MVSLTAELETKATDSGEPGKAERMNNCLFFIVSLKRGCKMMEKGEGGCIQIAFLAALFSVSPVGCFG